MNILIMKPVNGRFTVTVSVDPIGPYGEEESIDTRKIKEHLRSKNIPFDECVKSAVVTNTNLRTNFGEWIFTTPEEKEDDKTDTDEEEVPRPRKKRTTRRTRKTESEEE